MHGFNALSAVQLRYMHCAAAHQGFSLRLLQCIALLTAADAAA
jgi:hypothetical protein